VSKILYTDNFEFSSDALAQAAYVSSDAKFALQLREHKDWDIYNPAITFTEPSTGVVKCNSTNGSIGRGYIFVSLPKAWLHGKKVSLTWETSSAHAAFFFDATIYDGSYDRSSDVDFPSGSVFLTKGNGLLQTIEDLDGTNASHTVTITMDLSEGSQDYVTIFVSLTDVWNTVSGWFEIENLQIKDTSDNVLWSYDSIGDVDMEETGTKGDYGLYGTGNINLTCFSEATIKEQGSYALKGVTVITDSLDDTLTRTLSDNLDLSNSESIEYDIYALRTGSNIKIGIHDSGGTTTEHTANVASSNTNQTESWDISGVSDANKDDIDSIIITIMNADAANTFYLDDIKWGVNAGGSWTFVN